MKGLVGLSLVLFYIVVPVISHVPQQQLDEDYYYYESYDNDVNGIEDDDDGYEYWDEHIWDHLHHRHHHQNHNPLREPF
jgi:hypothetical protein